MEKHGIDKNRFIFEITDNNNVVAVFPLKMLPQEFLLDTIYQVQVGILGYFPREELTLHLSYK